MKFVENETPQKLIADVLSNDTKKRFVWIYNCEKTSHQRNMKINSHEINEPPHDKTNKMACAPSKDISA